MSSERTAPLLLLGGAGLGAWVWDDVRAELGPGHETHVAAYPRGTDAGLTGYAERVLADAPWPSFTVVAHSLGGAIAAELAALAPSRVDGVLGVVAVVPRPGASFFGTLPVPQRWIVPAVVRLLGTHPPERMLRGGLCAGLPEPLADRVVGTFEPETRGVYVDRAGVPCWPARRGYVRTTADADTPAALQERCAANLGATWRAELATGHLPMLEDPAGLAAVIERFAGGASLEAARLAGARRSA